MLLEAGQLQMVGFGLYSVGLYFQSGLRIVVHHRCKVKNEDGSVLTWNAETDIVSGDTKVLTQFLGSDLQSYRIMGNHELILKFTNDLELILIADQDIVESFVIRFPDRSVLVV